jgi:hypothetical protein
MMKEYLVYHNPDVMGFELTNAREFSIVTNKKVGNDVRGSRIWLITGKGRPREFFLCNCFVVYRIGPGTRYGFKTRLSGKEGKSFGFMPLNQENWLHDLKRSQGNFAFGFQRITQSRFINGLKRIAASY